MNTQNTINAQSLTDSINPTGLIAQLNSFGFDAGLAVATEAEIQVGAACGQMSLVNNEEQN